MRHSTGIALIALIALSVSFAVLGCRDKATAPKGSASASPAGPTSHEPLRFVVAPPPIGDKYRMQHASHLKVVVEFWQDDDRLGTSESKRDEDVAANVEVLGVVGTSPAKVRVRYDRYRLEEAAPDKPARKDAYLEGHTYVVDTTTAPPVVTDESQKAAGEEEATAVRTQFANLGQDDPLFEALRPYRLEVGKPVVLGEKLFRALLGASPGDFKSGRLTVERVTKDKNDEIAVMQWTGELETHEDNGMVTNWHLKGTAHVALKPARLLKSQTHADMDVSGKMRKEGAWVKMEGDGTMSDDFSITR